MNYYETQLDLINFRSEYSARVRFSDENATTKFMCVNHESARAIINT